MPHSAGNDQFAFHTFHLAPDTDQSMFTTDHAHYGQLISINYAYHTFPPAPNTDKSTFTTGHAHYGQLISINYAFQQFPLAPDTDTVKPVLSGH